MVVGGIGGLGRIGILGVGGCEVLEAGAVGDGCWVNRGTRSGQLRGVGGEGSWQWLLGE